MKKLFLFWLLSIFSLSLFGCGSKDNGVEVQNTADITVEEEINQTEEVDDIKNDEKLLSIYPELEGFDWSVILWDTLQTNYIESDNTVYFDPYRWMAFKLWAEFNEWLIREIDTDEEWYPHSEIILLVKWEENEENEENRTWINWYTEVYTIKAVSKQILEDFHVTPDFIDSVLWENNNYYFIGLDWDASYISDLTFFDVE